MLYVFKSQPNARLWCNEKQYHRYDQRKLIKKTSPKPLFRRSGLVLITAHTKRHRMSELHNTISGRIYFAWKNPRTTITLGSAGTGAPFNLSGHARWAVNKSIHRPAARPSLTNNGTGLGGSWPVRQTSKYINRHKDRGYMSN